MKLFLNNLLKGLLTAFVVICLGGFLSLNMSMSPTKAMVLVSSSLVNSIKTESENDTLKENKEEIDLKNLEEKIQLEEEIKEEPKDSPSPSNIDSSDENLVSEEEKTRTEEKETTNSKPDSSTTTEEKQETSEKVEEVVVQDPYAPNLEVLNTVTAIQTYYGKITAYGPDCYGCTSGRTASGQYVMEGNIYYQDKTYGNIRIVAADKSIPFGSIIKITGINISSDPILAIVLDRGGAIGFSEGKHAYFDLLYKSEKDALSFGRQNATFELLRQGY